MLIGVRLRRLFCCPNLGLAVQIWGIRIDVPLGSDNFKNAAGFCDPAEMEKCRSKGVLLKGCHNHRKGQLTGEC